LKEGRSYRKHERLQKKDGRAGGRAGKELHKKENKCMKFIPLVFSPSN
jgi:hypothetical protein